MTDVTLFINDTLGSAVLNVDEDLVRRDVRDEIERRVSGFGFVAENRRLIADTMASLLVQHASDWISGYVFNQQGYQQTTDDLRTLYNRLRDGYFGFGKDGDAGDQRLLATLRRVIEDRS